MMGRLASTSLPTQEEMISSYNPENRNQSLHFQDHPERQGWCCLFVPCNFSLSLLFAISALVPSLVDFTALEKHALLEGFFTIP